MASISEVTTNFGRLPMIFRFFIKSSRLTTVTPKLRATTLGKS